MPWRSELIFGADVTDVFFDELALHVVGITELQAADVAVQAALGRAAHPTHDAQLLGQFVPLALQADRVNS